MALLTLQIALGYSSEIFAHVTELPWLKFSPLIVAFVITLCEALTRGSGHRWFYKGALPVLSGVALIASCWIVWSDDKVARASKEKENAHLDRIEGKLGDEEATKRYLEAVGSLTRQLTAAKTGSAVEKFFGSEAERHKLRSELDQTNRKLLLTYEIRMNPVRDYVIAKFDSWIAEIRKRGVKVEVATSETPSVIVGVRKYAAVRNAGFESGDRVELQFHSAVVQDGRLTEVLIGQLVFTSARGTVTNGAVFNVQIEENNYRINKTRARFIYKEYVGKLDNPIEDREFIALLDDALDEAMAFVVEEATAQK